MGMGSGVLGVQVWGWVDRLGVTQMVLGKVKGPKTKYITSSTCTYVSKVRNPSGIISLSNLISEGCFDVTIFNQIKHTPTLNTEQCTG